MPCTFSTGWKHVKPIRPYRSLQEFATKQHWLGLHPADKWPCLACSGRGWNYDPQDPPCPVEGNRDRRTVPCAACGGSGQGTKEACRKAYQEAIARFRQEAKEYEGFVKARRQALKKLTAEEVQALRELGV